MRRPRRFLARFRRTVDGAAAAEHALIVAIVCCGIAVGASLLTGSIDKTFSLLTVCLEAPLACLART